VEAGTGSRRTVVADTSTLLNFINLDRLDLLCREAGYRIVVTEHVRAEVIDEEQTRRFQRAIAEGLIEVMELHSQAELSRFASLNRVLGRGEAAAIALSSCQGWMLALDEKGRARREAEEQLGREGLLNTIGIIVKCIRVGALSVEEADTLKDDLARHRFVIKLRSFRDLV
jgi:predicted nucleic acid-binding protein